jgi:hypothetical protein
LVSTQHTSFGVQPPLLKEDASVEGASVFCAIQGAIGVDHLTVIGPSITAPG